MQTVVSLTLSPIPTLVINDEVIHGINIIERLYKLKDESTKANELYVQAANAFQRSHIPSLGYRLLDERAVAPTKRIIDVGYDLTIIDVYSQPTQLTTLYETGVALCIPLGYYVELVPRSSISKTGYMLANSVGVIDPSYQGSIKVPLIKVDPSMPDIELPFRVAQLILKPYNMSELYDATNHTHVETTRGIGGFGSTN